MEGTEFWIIDAIPELEVCKLEEGTEFWSMLDAIPKLELCSMEEGIDPWSMLEGIPELELCSTEEGTEFWSMLEDTPELELCSMAEETEFRLLTTELGSNEDTEAGIELIGLRSELVAGMLVNVFELTLKVWVTDDAGFPSKLDNELWSIELGTAVGTIETANELEADFEQELGQCFATTGIEQEAINKDLLQSGGSRGL